MQIDGADFREAEAINLRQIANTSTVIVYKDSSSVHIMRALVN